MEEKVLMLGKTPLIIKSTFRSFILFEEMTGKQAIEVETFKDGVQLMYCVLKAANKETFDYSFNEFVDKLDEYPDFFSSYNNLTIPEKKTIEGALDQEVNN